MNCTNSTILFLKFVHQILHDFNSWFIQFYFSVSCEARFEVLKHDINVVSCPPNYAAASGSVIGKVGVYHYKSAICRSAIHAGETTGEF